jgi:hypothetical protein
MIRSHMAFAAMVAEQVGEFVELDEHREAL